MRWQRRRGAVASEAWRGGSVMQWQCDAMAMVAWQEGEKRLPIAMPLSFGSMRRAHSKSAAASLNSPLGGAGALVGGRR